MATFTPVITTAQSFTLRIKRAYASLASRLASNPVEQFVRGRELSPKASKKKTLAALKAARHLATRDDPHSVDLAMRLLDRATRNLASLQAKGKVDLSVRQTYGFAPTVLTNTGDRERYSFLPPVGARFKALEPQKPDAAIAQHAYAEAIGHWDRALDWTATDNDRRSAVAESRQALEVAYQHMTREQQRSLTSSKLKEASRYRVGWDRLTLRALQLQIWSPTHINHLRAAYRASVVPAPGQIQQPLSRQPAPRQPLNNALVSGFPQQPGAPDSSTSRNVIPYGPRLTVPASAEPAPPVVPAAPVPRLVTTGVVKTPQQPRRVVAYKPPTALRNEVGPNQIVPDDLGRYAAGTTPSFTTEGGGFARPQSLEDQARSGLPTTSIATALHQSRVQDTVTRYAQQIAAFQTQQLSVGADPEKPAIKVNPKLVEAKINRILFGQPQPPDVSASTIPSRQINTALNGIAMAALGQRAAVKTEHARAIAQVRTVYGQKGVDVGNGLGRDVKALVEQIDTGAQRVQPGERAFGSSGAPQRGLSLDHSAAEAARAASPSAADGRGL